jgi:hypothetical protein
MKNIYFTVITLLIRLVRQIFEQCSSYVYSFESVKPPDN